MTTLVPATISSLNTLADKINAEHRACETAVHASVDHAIAAGRLLIEAKASLPHGRWLPWLEEYFEASVVTAQRYMRVTEWAESLPPGNTSTVTHLTMQEVLSRLTKPRPIPLGNGDAPLDTEGTDGVTTLAVWRSLDEGERAAVLATPRSMRSTFNRQASDNIEWAKWSWNPVMGCLHNCSYCYARDIAERFYPQGFAPTFAPERLDAPRHTKVPTAELIDGTWRNVFTCSMADLFGKWVPVEWIEAVLESVRDNPQWNFLFLTKFPRRLAEFEFPPNAWVGTSVDAQARVKNAEDAMRDVRASVKWYSCEPMLEPLEFTDLTLVNWIVIGGASRSTETPEFRPPRAWVNRLEAQAHAAGCYVYEKTNLLERLREYPGQDEAAAVDVPAAFKMHYLKRDLLQPADYEQETGG